MTYSGEIYHESGVAATLSGVKVRLYRDITNSGDTYRASLPCGSSFNPASSFHADAPLSRSQQPQRLEFKSYQYYGN